MIGRSGSSSTGFTIALVVNSASAFLAFSTLLERKNIGELTPKVGITGLEYFGLAIGITALCALTGLLIRYDQYDARWGARFLACGLPAILVWLYPFAIDRPTVFDSYLGS